jgi:hypothetical protein
VLPSKLFSTELRQTGVGGRAGYAADFVHTEIDNAAGFSPFNARDAMRAFADLKLQTTPRPAFVERYSRRAITRRFAADVLAALAAQAAVTAGAATRRPS